MAENYYMCVRWDKVNNLAGEYTIFTTRAEAVVCWNSRTVTATQNCACWEILESNDWEFTQNQANSFEWK